MTAVEVEVGHDGVEVALDLGNRLIRATDCLSDDADVAASRHFRTEVFGEVGDHFRGLRSLAEPLLFIKVDRRY